MSYPGGQDPYGQGQQGPNPYGQPANPQNPYPYGQPPANPQYPYGQPTGPQNPYGQPQQYAQPGYGQPQMYAQQAAAPRPAAQQNPYARNGLIYGVIAFVITVVAGFFGYYIVGIFGIYAAYASIRGLIAGAGSPSHKGLIEATIGLLLGLLSIVLTIAFAIGLI